MILDLRKLSSSERRISKQMSKRFTTPRTITMEHSTTTHNHPRGNLIGNINISKLKSCGARSNEEGETDWM